MIKTTTLQLYAGAKAVKRLIQGGMHNPKVEEIAVEAYGGQQAEFWPVGKTQIDWFVRHLWQIKDILENEEEMTVLLVNKEFFSTFRRRQPSTIELAKEVLPSKGKRKPAGLHLVTSENDTIWEASQDRRENRGVGIVKKYKAEVTKAVKENRLTLDNGEQIVRTLKEKM
jgi:hypothetical protein